MLFQLLLNQGIGCSNLRILASAERLISHESAIKCLSLKVLIIGILIVILEINVSHGT